MNAKPSLEILEPSLISKMAHVSHPRPRLETWVSTPRAFTADTPSKASTIPSRRPVTRSHRHHVESEA